MIEEKFQKPPPLLLPPAKNASNSCTGNPSIKNVEKLMEEKAVQKFTARYDAFQGILRRVTEMKLNGSLGFEEPSTGSEKSESSKRRVQSRSSSADGRSSANAFEDESSSSSITGSDHCPPYEEIPRVCCGDDRGSGGLPPRFARGPWEVSSREGFVPRSPAARAREGDVSIGNSPKEYKREEGRKGRSLEDSARPKSLVGVGDRGTSSSSFSAEVEENRTKILEKRLSLDDCGQPEGISEAEKHQLEMFFKSLKTDVFVCGSLANLYFGWKEGEGNWSYGHTGVVVVVFDSGDTRCRSKRKIQILLAERGTCFPLWKDTIDNLSAYHRSGTAFHAMYLSSDHRQMVGLSFDSAREADRLLQHLEELTSNPENINISVPESKKKKKSRLKKQTTPLPQKKNISNPCLFQHLTNVAAKDKPIYMSMQTLIDNENMKKGENIC